MKKQAYPDFDQFPEEAWFELERELEPLREQCGNLTCEVFRTPGRSLDGVLAKTRLAYRVTCYMASSRAPLDDMTPPTSNNIGGLDDPQLLWSILRDLERLAREARS